MPRFLPRFLPLLAGLLLSLTGLAQLQTAPAAMGNYFEFRPQLAQNTLLPRFPENWTKPPAPHVYIQGFGWPFTNLVAEGTARFTRMGFTHAERPEFVALLNLPVSQRFLLARDADAGGPNPDGTPGGEAGRWGNSLPDSDPRKAHLLNYGRSRSVTSTDYSIYRELGKRTWNTVKGAGLGLVGMDIETFADNTPISVQEQFTAAVNLGFGDGIAADGAPTKVFQYGGSLCSFSIYTQSRESDKWMRTPGSIWQGAGGLFNIDATPIATYYRTIGAYVGRDQYTRHTFDDQHSFYLKNPDGTIKVDGNGKPLWYLADFPNTTISNFGRTAVITQNEARLAAQETYEEMDKILMDWRWLCNTDINYQGNVGEAMPFPKGTYDIRPGLQNLKLCGWFRDGTESATDYDAGQLPPDHNNRPLYDKFIRFTVAMRTLFYHGNIMWSDKSWKGYVTGQPFLREGGGQYVEQAPLAMGQYEMMAAGHYQASNFPKYFELFDTGKLDFIWPVRFVKSGNDAESDWESNKPIIALQKEHLGRRLFAEWIWPTQDVGNPSLERDATIWVVLDNGTTSGSWKIHFADRKFCMDAWMLPTGFEGAKPENFRIQYTGLTGKTFTRTGNYNVPVSGNPTPPPLITRTPLTP